MNLSSKHEHELEKKIIHFIEHQKDYEEKIRSNIKEIENLKLELKKAHDTHKNYVEKIEYEFLIIILKK